MDVPPVPERSALVTKREASLVKERGLFNKVSICCAPWVISSKMCVSKEKQCFSKCSRRNHIQVQVHLKNGSELPGGRGRTVLSRAAETYYHLRYVVLVDYSLVVLLLLSALSLSLVVLLLVVVVVVVSSSSLLSLLLLSLFVDVIDYIISSQYYLEAARGSLPAKTAPSQTRAEG